MLKLVGIGATSLEPLYPCGTAIRLLGVIGLLTPPPLTCQTPPVVKVISPPGMGTICLIELTCNDASVMVMASSSTAGSETFMLENEPVRLVQIVSGKPRLPA